MKFCAPLFLPLKLISLLPLSMLHGLADILAWLSYRLLSYRKKVVFENLRLAFPKWDHAQIRKTARAFYGHLADVLVESVKSLSLSEREMRKRMQLENPELFDQLKADGKGIMLVWGHQTNFEWMATGLPLLIPQKVFAVFQPLRNACMGQKIVEIRERFGLKLFPMDETYPFMLNNPVQDAAYIFMADQSPQKKRIKYRTRFFGMDTPVHLGVENLSKKMDLSVVFIYAKRVSRGHYSLKARLLTDRPAELPDHQITDTHVRWLEEEIREEPAHWLWSHRRWKHRTIENG